MRKMEQEMEDNRCVMQKEERRLQKAVDMLRSNHSKIESEMVLKDKEVTEIRDETDAIRNQITQVIINLISKLMIISLRVRLCSIIIVSFSIHADWRGRK